MSEPNAEYEYGSASRVAVVMSVSDHCFREDNCSRHQDHWGDKCCCCGQVAEAHEGCDCE